MQQNLGTVTVFTQEIKFNMNDSVKVLGPKKLNLTVYSLFKTLIYHKTYKIVLTTDQIMFFYIQNVL